MTAPKPGAKRGRPPTRPLAWFGKEKPRIILCLAARAYAPGENRRYRTVSREGAEKPKRVRGTFTTSEARAALEAEGFPVSRRALHALLQRLCETGLLTHEGSRERPAEAAHEDWRGHYRLSGAWTKTHRGRGHSRLLADPPHGEDPRFVVSNLEAEMVARTDAEGVADFRR